MKKEKKSIKSLETKAVKNTKSIYGRGTSGNGKALNVQGGTDTTVTVWPK